MAQASSPRASVLMVRASSPSRSPWISPGSGRACAPAAPPGNKSASAAAAMTRPRGAHIFIWCPSFGVLHRLALARVGAPEIDALRVGREAAADGLGEQILHHRVDLARLEELVGRGGALRAEAGGAPVIA